jgi:hypothetical protein
MPQPDIFNLIAASGPYPEHADQLVLYGQFVGSWDIDATWFEENGEQRKARGEWHFAWILGGRGVQDVLFAAGSPPDHYGVTLRCYDSASDAWHITWMQPCCGDFVNLTGRKEGNRIVQIAAGSDPQRRERWSFTEITPDSFLWLGEASFDGGATWILEQEMRAARRRHTDLA